MRIPRHKWFYLRVIIRKTIYTYIYIRGFVKTLDYNLKRSV